MDTLGSWVFGWKDVLKEILNEQFADRVLAHKVSKL